jgi:hypothetical protein
MTPEYASLNERKVVVESVSMSRRDIYGVIIPLIPVHSDYSDSAKIKLYFHQKVHSCPQIQKRTMSQISGQLLNDHQCIYSEVPELLTNYSVVSNEDIIEWSYIEKEKSVYSPWILIH